MDYKALGFRCGLEIHQQLEGLKLFWNTPTVIRKDKPDFTINRRLRASAGETGKSDQAALYEMAKAKTFVYQGYDDTSLVAIDEAPPLPMNEEALLTALQVCKMLNARVVDQVQVMRKTVVDGSNVSGFQRTALIGRDGYVEINGRRIGVPTICLEEEACQVVKRTESADTYNLSRLGIPLLEIATSPDISSPEECREVAAKLGMILRSTGRVKRGIGSIRQDVNLSIKGAGRVEIKGFQDLKSIPKVIDNEIKRQLKEKKVESHVRKAEPDHGTSYLRPMPGAARMYPETDIPKIVPPTAEVEVPVLLSEKAEGYEKNHGLPQGYGKQLVKAGVDFDSLAKKYKDPRVLAEFLVKLPKDLKSREGVVVNPMDHLEVLGKYDEGLVPRSALSDVVLARSRGEKVDYSKFGVSDEEVVKAIKELVRKDPSAPVGALMGRLMQKFKGRLDGKKAMELLRKNR